ncbi:MAG: molybdopterin molybdotransferase MoeA [Steroidobacteraceae bacterium]
MSLLTPAEADRLIGAHLRPLAVESLPLAQCAGAVLREDIFAERDQPPFDRVAMDGIALQSQAVREGLRRFQVQGIQGAGDAPATLVDRAHCIEIMTGAMLAQGCDAVVPVERITRRGDAAMLDDALAVEPWQNVHRRGSDAREGARLLAAGTTLRAPEIAVAASAGKARLRVAAQPSIIVVSTGNELVEPGEPILPHQVRRSNAYGLATQLRLRGFGRVADDHVVDDAQALRTTLRLHLDTHDVLILSGGVSAGRFDLVPQVLAELGVQQHFHKIAQRPGKPLWFGTAPSGAAVFGLPGNPVSSLVCLARYVVPALRAAAGRLPRPAERVTLAASVRVTPPLAYFLPVSLARDGEGALSAEPRPTNGSGDFTSLVGTDGFVELPPGPNEYARGFVAPYYRW